MPPSGKIFILKKSTVCGMSNCVFNFNFLALVVSEILGGTKFTLGAYAPLTPIAEKFLYVKRVLHNI